MKNKAGRRTVGFLTFDIAGTYNNTMWRHLFQCAADRNIDLITFCGGVLLDESLLHRQWNKIYDLASAQNVDGLIVLAASLSQSCGKEKLSGFLSRFAPLPMVSIGVALNEAVSILLDNEAGMRKIVSHMLDRHQMKRPLFLAGPRNNDEANLRLRAFTDEMHKRGLAIQDEMIRQVAFRYDLAIEAVENAITTGLQFDSIIAVNDDSALGAFDALQRRGRRVPHDIAISGFDDTEQSRCNSVPLSTVQQPHREMACQAVEAIIRCIDGEEVDRRQLLASKLIIRKSCGCLLKGYLSRKDISTQADTASIDSQSKNFFPSNIISALQTLFNSFMESGDYSELIAAFDDQLMVTVRGDYSEDIFTDWHNFITRWSVTLNESSSYSEEQKKNAVDFFNQAHFVVIEAEKNIQSSKRLEAEKKDYLFILFSSYFSPLIDMGNFLSHLSRELPKFGVISFYVSLFTDKAKTASKTVLYYLPSGQTYWNIDGIAFDSGKLLPDELFPDQRYSIVVEPLLNYEEIIGYFVFHLNEPIEIIENVRQIITNSFLSILLAQEVIRDKQLKTLLANLELKQEQLEEAYRSLKENQEKMLVIDKLASLGRMTAGIAHEMNTPIASIRASVTELQRLVEEYKASIGDSEVEIQDHHAIAQEMQHSLSLAEKAAEKAAAFVHGIKSQTRDLAPKERFSFDAVKVVQEALLLLGHSLKQQKCDITFTSNSEYMELNGAPGRLAQIITNLVNNAIEACPKDGSGKIGITMHNEKDGILLCVNDNGCGISKQNTTRIFDPMFTTKPFGVGTGLGLTLVHDIVNGDFGGRIELESEENNGTEFKIYLKRTQEN